MDKCTIIITTTTKVKDVDLPHIFIIMALLLVGLASTITNMVALVVVIIITRTQVLVLNYHRVMFVRDVEILVIMLKSVQPIMINSLILYKPRVCLSLIFGDETASTQMSSNRIVIKYSRH